MFPQSRDHRGRISLGHCSNVITAEFLVPSGGCSSKEGLTIFPKEVNRDAPADQKSSRGRKKGSPDKDESPNEIPPFNIRLDSGHSIWKLDVCKTWLYELSPPAEDFDLIEGSIYFRCKSFGSWEPVEFLKYFATDNDKGEESDVNADVESPEERIVHPIFPVELLETSVSEFALEMTLRFAHFDTSRGEEDAILNKHRAEMHNKLLPVPLKSDLTITVNGEKFLVHSKQIIAFSSKIKIAPNRKGRSNCDWSNLLTPDSTRALLQYIYYDEVETISSPQIAFSLLKFSKKFEDSCFLKICENKLMKFSDESHTLPDILEMYSLVKSIDDLKMLENYFVGVLSRRTKQSGTTELTNLMQGYDNGLVKDLLMEISKFEQQPEDDKPPRNKRRRKRAFY